MIRAKEGATRAPHETCLTQESDPVSGSASSLFYFLGDQMRREITARTRSSQNAMITFGIPLGCLPSLLSFRSSARRLRLRKTTNANTATIITNGMKALLFMILPNVAMLRDYGWRGGCPAAAAPDTGVG